MAQHNSIINFGAGPAALPAGVLAEASRAILDYNNTGLSILGIPHRGKLFDAILTESKQLVLELANLDPSEYEVLWLQGGGRLQFTMIPMNFLEANSTAGYIESGFWANDAQQSATAFGKVLTLASSKENQYRSLPQLPETIPDNLAYVHLTTNNTIFGTQIKEIPATSVPLFADMSSDIFSEERDYNRFDLFYAVAQKNIGAAGVTLVVIRKSLLNKIVRPLPPVLSYKQQAAGNSVLNTPPVFNIYVSLLSLRWIKAKGIQQITKETNEKSALLYRELERNTLFTTTVEAASRSKMNVVFCGKDEDIEKDFLAYSIQHQIEGIAGHRSVGGFRVSLYNAITVPQTQYLIEVMQQFEQEKIKQSI